MCDVLFDILTYANLAKNVDSEIERVHLSNFAIGQTELDKNPGVFQLIWMYEDTALDEFSEAESLAEKVEMLLPGKFVLIETGDYIRHILESENDWLDPELETYDPNYRLLLVDKELYNSVQEEIQRIDQNWRFERQAIADGVMESYTLCALCIGANMATKFHQVAGHVCEKHFQECLVTEERLNNAKDISVPFSSGAWG